MYLYIRLRYTWGLWPQDDWVHTTKDWILSLAARLGPLNVKDMILTHMQRQIHYPYTISLNHILNCCNKSLTNGKYLWRHNNVLHHIKKCIEVKKFTLYIDPDENRQSRKSTIPPNAVVTTLIPDIVLIDEKTKSLEIFELTCPAETRIDIAHLLKVEKYAHLVNDIKEYKTEVNVFEIGSHTGQITKRNKECLSKLHTYCQKFIKKQTFIKNISAITMLGSYHVFNSRDEEDWVECSPILAPFEYTNQKQ